MPLPTGAISLYDIGNIAYGSYDMNNAYVRKLCGVNLTSGTQWSLSDARGKSWVTGFSADATPGSPYYWDTTVYYTFRHSNYNPSNGSGTVVGTYNCSVSFRRYTMTTEGDYGTAYYFKYVLNSVSDSGGGFWATPSLILLTYTYGGAPDQYATYTATMP